MNTSNTVTSKGTTTIPKHVRDKLGIEPGDKVQFYEAGGEFKIKKAPSFAEVRTASKKFLRGRKVKRPTNDEVKKRMAQQAADRYRRAMSIHEES